MVLVFDSQLSTFSFESSLAMVTSKGYANFFTISWNRVMFPQFHFYDGQQKGEKRQNKTTKLKDHFFYKMFLYCLTKLPMATTFLYWQVFLLSERFHVDKCVCLNVDHVCN